jgi:hypothetical protein
MTDDFDTFLGTRMADHTLAMIQEHPGLSGKELQDRYRAAMPLALLESHGMIEWRGEGWYIKEET